MSMTLHLMHEICCAVVRLTKTVKVKLRTVNNHLMSDVNYGGRLQGSTYFFQWQYSMGLHGARATFSLCSFPTGTAHLGHLSLKLFFAGNSADGQESNTKPSIVTVCN